MRSLGLGLRLDRKALSALLVSAGLALAACSGDNTNGNAVAPGGGVEAGVPDPEPTPADDASTPPDPGVICGAADSKPGAGSKTITVAGSKRTYELFVPDTYDRKKTFPLIFVFHGDGGTGANMRSYLKLEAEAAGQAIFVYPDGEAQTWNIDDAAGLATDLAFIDALAATLAKTHCTDTKRVFSVGFSKGAYFTNMLACLGKTKLRAVVAHSGGGPFGLDGSGTDWDSKGNLICPSAPVAAMQIIGSSDGLLGDAKQARDYWQRVNSCKRTTKPFETSPCVTYDGCAADRPEIYCEIPGMGHSIWQNATKVTWAFLKSK
jgi:polyhydroxybutyrate depolymerase